MNARRTWMLAVVTSVLALPSAVIAQLSPEDIAALQERGRAEGWTFTVGESEATRRPLHELCGAVEPPDWRSNAVFDNRPLTRDLPAAYDWRDYNGCTPVRNQGGCGSCWAFGAIGTVESMVLINESLSRDLSEQWLVSCTGAGDCGGGWHTIAYDYLKTGGLQDPCGDSGAVLEADFPYVAWDAPCDCPYPHPHPIYSWAVVGPEWSTPSAEQIKQAILDHGPVSTCVYVSGAFRGYDEGVFNACESGQINHVVDLVGWDDNQGMDGVWILRNSWGTTWGMSGYMLIEYGCNRVGYATCYVNYAPQDCNSNGLPDRCDVDCEAPSGPCDLPGCGESPDCNGNRIPDECDLDSGMSTDYNGNGVPDECEQDCDHNGVPDECDLSCLGGCAGAPGCGQSPDCQPDLILDECQVLGAHVPSPAPSCSAPADNGSPWCDDFESYAFGPIFGYNWEGWYGNPDNLGIITDEQNHTAGGSKSLKIQNHDTVRLFFGYDWTASLYWLLRANVYVPSTMSADAWFIVNPDYYGGDGTTWSVQLTMNADTGTIENWYGLESLPLVTDGWAEIRCEINFVADMVTIYYNDAFLTSYPWTIGGGSLSIATVDLYSPDPSGFYYDDLSLFPAVSKDCQPNGVPDACDIAGGAPDDNGNGVPDECDCDVASAPQPDPTLTDLGFGTKNRYLSFSGGDAGRQQAARVKFISLPYYLGPEPPANYDFRYAEGRTMWVQEPGPVTEAAGADTPVPPPTFWAATLDCEPYYTDWTQYDRVDVYDAGIIPDGLYNVQFIDIECLTFNDEGYSAALPVSLSEAGDVVGSSPGPAPQGVVDFVDISAVVDKFKNAPGSIRKARADITNGNLVLPHPDRKVDFVDISCLVSAFRADPCSIPGPPPDDPCTGR